jgi:hypothetical protein
MAPVKASMSQILPNVKVVDTTFCIRFSIGDKLLMSDPFKIVSSCSQLPGEIRYDVRPSKKNSDKTSPKSSKRRASEEEAEEP